MLQLSSLYTKKTQYYELFKGIDFYFPLRIIGKGLSLLLSIDCMVTDSTFYEASFISNYWSKYKDTFNLIFKDPVKYGADQEKMKLLKRIVVKADMIMKGDGLNTFLNHLSKENNIMAFEESSDLNAFRGSKYINELLKKYFKTTQNQMEVMINDGSNLQFRDSETLSEYLCVFAFYIKVFRAENKDVWKSIWALQKRVLMIYIHRSVMMRICDFLMKYCAPKKMYSSIEPKDINKFTIDILKRSQETLMGDVVVMYRQICQWALKMNSISSSMFVFMTVREEERSRVFELRINHILTGLTYVRRLRELIRNNFLMRQKIGYSVSSELVKPLLLLVEMKKKMMEVLEHKDTQIMQDFMVKFLCLKITRVIKEYCNRITSQKLSDKTFIIEAFRTIFFLTTHQPSEQREMLRTYCVTFLGIKNIVKEPEVAQFNKMILELNALVNYKQYFREGLDCSYLYWLKELIPEMLELKTTVDGEYFRMNYFMDALQDAKCLLSCAVHLHDNSQLVERFTAFVLDSLTQKVVKKVAVYLEEDLLIQTHHFYAVSIMEKPNPLSKFQGDLKTFFEIRKLNVLDKIIDLKYLIEVSLAEGLYNRISDNQKNYDLYEIMRVLAYSKYGLDLGHSYIPSKTVEQGKTDILAILRSLIFFIQNFKYNMFNQTFIECLNDSTRLKAVSINLISDSIKTHGLGIIKNSINIVVEQIHRYPFLTQANQRLHHDDGQRHPQQHAG